MKIALRGAQQLIERAEERISKLEDTAIKITHSEEHREKKDEMNEQSLREMWGTIKCTNEQVTGVTQREEREKGAENGQRNNGQPSQTEWRTIYKLKKLNVLQVRSM